jgi:hypothetical protein
MNKRRFKRFESKIRSIVHCSRVDSFIFFYYYFIIYITSKNDNTSINIEWNASNKLRIEIKNGLRSVSQDSRLQASSENIRGPILEDQSRCDNSNEEVFL